MDDKIYDIIILGGGISGSFIADILTEKGMNVLMLEAGPHLNEKTFPTNEIKTSSKLYWSGGIEFNHSSEMAFLRPKIVGGGSVINGALVDRFDSIAFNDWRSQSKIDYMNIEYMNKWYQKAESMFNIEKIDENYRNKNANIFKDGMDKLSFKTDILRRAQKNCQYETGNDCIECLSGCRINSKQMMSVCTLNRAQSRGLRLVANFNITQITANKNLCKVFGNYHKREFRIYKAKQIVLACGSIGNTKLLFQSGLKRQYPALGKNFYTHPQFLKLALYEEKIQSFKGPLQTYKSAEPQFRSWGFKLENVFAPPAGLSLLIPTFGKKLHKYMQQIDHMSCIEVAIRDTNPGTMYYEGENFVVEKTLNHEDVLRKEKGFEIIDSIFEETGAREILESNVAIGLHLMGGLAIGTDSIYSVTSPEFYLHNHKNIYVADSSIFPNAPGINPSLTIMALSLKAAYSIVGETL